ncbi:unnamed protein product, partial [Mesorhabditis belari]|uniref:ornithine decarboxylase n=1 Tax=Mesorhabditis belari TaxID=2138241 RepID=A0AAF3JC53_9BILA
MGFGAEEDRLLREKGKAATGCGRASEVAAARSEVAARAKWPQPGNAQRIHPKIFPLTLVRCARPAATRYPLTLASTSEVGQKKKEDNFILIKRGVLKKMTMIKGCSRRELIGDIKVEIHDDPIIAEEMVEALANKYDSEDVHNSLSSVDVKRMSVEIDDAFLLINLDALLERFKLWKRELPHVEPFYAVKCNTDVTMLRVLAALGVNFDCASKQEIDIVLSIGVDPSRIIYANPCKTRAFIKLMTFDNAEELEKIQELHNSARLVPRIAVSDPTATCPLNLKFGADPVHAAPKLLAKAKQMGVNVEGISFHVGSGCNDCSAYEIAIAHARRLFDLGEAMGHHMNFLDLGGGFPGGKHHIAFEQISAVISGALCRYFPDPAVRVVAEPGRFFAARPFTLCANVIHSTAVNAERITHNDKDIGSKGMMYYLNDGVYGSFNCILFDHVHPKGHPLRPKEGAEAVMSTIWGPTCDSLDQIEDKKMMEEMSTGDWIVYPEMGAYTSAASTTFNGFQRPIAIYAISQANWETIADLL